MKTFHHCIATAAAFFGLCGYTFAQEHAIEFERIGLNQGLSQSSINCILQDRSGFLWFGTQDGLNRYDGYSFTIYKKIDSDSLSINDNWVNALCESRDGMIWIGTERGVLSKYDPSRNTFHHYRYRNEESGKVQAFSIRAIAEDEKGFIWVGSEGGLSRLDRNTGEWKHFPSSFASLNAVTALYVDRRGRILFGTVGGGLHITDGEKFTAYRSRVDDPYSLSHNTVTAITEGRDGNFWIGTVNGLNFMDANTGSCKRYMPNVNDPYSLTNSAITALAEDPQGNLWIGTNAGLDVIKRGTHSFAHYRYKSLGSQSLSNNTVISLLADRTGTIWIGTNAGGINKYDPFQQKFAHFQSDPENPNSLSDNNVRAVYVDRSGLVWIGTETGGMDSYDPRNGRFFNYRYDSRSGNTISHNTIRAFFEDRRGELWIGTNGGLNKLDAARKYFSVFKNTPGDPTTLSSDMIRVIMEDREGMIWVGTYGGGLSRWDPGSKKFIRFQFNPDDSGSISDDRVMALCEDANGTLWIGTNGGGLNRFDPQTQRFIRFQNEAGNYQSLSNNRIRSIYADTRRGVLWIGTSGGGLNRMDPATGKFKRYSEENGLPNAVIYGILQDDHGFLWMSSNRGLTKFDPDKETFRNYDVNDGLQSNEFNSLAYFRDNKGTMYFGGINGFNVFHPDSIRDNPYLPPLVITAVERFDHHFPLTDPVRQEIILDYENNFIAFTFAALNFSNSAKNLYAYRLEGFDADWIYSGTRRYASYTNLDPGNYTFRIKGSNNDGLWNEEGTSVRLIVLPPFWKTWWFRLLILSTVVVIAWSIYNWRVRALQKQKAELEKLAETRTCELQRKKDELEKINVIVREINSQQKFVDLLYVILRQASIITGVEKATALVLDQPSRTFRFKASTGWEMESLRDIELTPEEATARYTENTEEIFPDIHIVRNVKGRSAEQKLHHLQLPKAMMIMRIRIDEAVEGYFVFDNMHDARAFENQEAGLLSNLKEHIVSAFIKTKLLEELRVLTSELKRLNEKKNEFLGIAAHDLRNPLSSIRGFMEIMIQDITRGVFEPEEGKKDLQRILAHCEHMTDLINQLLDISAIESGKIHFTIRPESWYPIIDERKPFHARAATQKNIRLNFDTFGESPKVKADRYRMTEVLDNLLSNAIKYTYPGGEVRVSCEAHPYEVITHIRDTGQGLSKEDLDRIFTTFGKLSARPTAGETSTGLGLAIVKKIVELHGGRVWVVSEKGKGSVFSFSLPKTEV
ncbi:hypothetical protein K1X84_15305 [bacterium]|nr:hypothetical protein [bacterium]